MVEILIPILCSCPILATCALIFLHWKWVLSSSSSEENEPETGPIPMPKLFMTIFWVISMVILAMSLGAIILYIMQQVQESSKRELVKYDGADIQKLFGESEDVGRRVQQIAATNLTTHDFSQKLQDYFKTKIYQSKIYENSVNFVNTTIQFVLTTKFENKTKNCSKDGQNFELNEEMEGRKIVQSIMNDMKWVPRTVSESTNSIDEMSLSGFVERFSRTPGDIIARRWKFFEKMMNHTKNDVARIPEKLKKEQDRQKSDSDGELNQHLVFGAAILCTILCLVSSIWIVQHVRSKKPEKRHPLIIYWTLSMFYVSSLVTIIFSLIFILLSFEAIKLSDCRVDANAMSFRKMTSRFEELVDGNIAVTSRNENHRLCAKKSETMFSRFPKQSLMWPIFSTKKSTINAMKFRIIPEILKKNVKELKKHYEELNKFVECEQKSGKTSIFSNFINTAKNYITELEEFTNLFPEHFMTPEIEKLDREIGEMFKKAENATQNSVNIPCSKIHEIFNEASEKVCDLVTNFQIQNVGPYAIFISFSSIFPTILLFLTHFWMNSERFEENVKMD